MRTTTIGQLRVNAVLPEDMQDYERELDKRGTNELLKQLALKHPDKYAEITKKLNDIGRETASRFGGYSFGVEHLRKSETGKKYSAEIQAKMKKILDRDDLTPQQRNELIVRTVGAYQEKQIDEIYQEALKKNNPIALQVLSGSRGNKMNLTSLLGSDMLYSDHRDEVIPLPVRSSYSQGLRPIEYWASTYGARRGTMATKFCIFGECLVLMADYSERKIKNIKPGDWVMGSDTSGKMQPVRVVRVHDNGKRACYRYLFRKGACRDTFLELTATEDHKVLSQVKSQRGVTATCVRTPTPLPLSAAKFYSDSTKNEYIAWVSRGEYGRGVFEPRALLAGLMLGDGCMAPSTKGRYSFSCADATLLRDVQEYLVQFNLKLSKSCKMQYGYNLREISRGVRKTKVVDGRNTFVAGHINATKKWLRSTLGDKLAHEKVLPDSVWHWDDISLGNLLGGLFSTDGCVSVCSNGVTIRFQLTSRKLVEQTQRLLELRFGIWTTGIEVIEASTKKFAVNQQYGFRISHPECVRRFANRVRLVGVKRKVLNDALPLLNADATKQKYGCKVHDREYVGELPTFDLEVDHPDHLFVLANGLVVSNSTQDSGFLSKQLNQIAHRLMVVDEDDPRDIPMRGLPVSTDDMDSEGSLLAHDIGPYKRNTVLTPKIIKHIKSLGHEKMLVRSPLVGGSPDGGVYARDVGVREFGVLPGRGEQVGLTAAQALSEPLSQGQLCLASGTQIRMADWSVKPIEAIVVGDLVLGSDRQGKTLPVRVVRCYDNGMRDCVKTVFGVGQSRERVELVSTPDHKILATTAKWPFSKTDYTLGVFPVAEKTRYFSGLMTTAAKFHDGRFANSDGICPFLLGVLLGDGCYVDSVNGVHLSCFDPTLVEYLNKSAWFTCTGIKATKLKGHKGYYRISQCQDYVNRDKLGQFVSGTRNPVRRYLEDYALWGKYAHEKCLPDEVWSWRTNDVGLLLAGLFVTDGSVYVNVDQVNRSKCYISYCSTSRKLVEQVKDLLDFRFAIHASRIYETKSKKRKRTLYQINITTHTGIRKFAAAIRLEGIKKIKLAKALAAWHVERDVDHDKFYRKEQTPVGRVRTYDIEVDHPDHLFVLANGLIVSNSAKHSGGVAGQEKAVGGFQYVNQLIQVPEKFKGGAAHATEDGFVDRIVDAPAGGKIVWVNGKEHYVPPSAELKVKKGDSIEAGDVLSNGFPHPAIVVEHKGIGEGKRYFTSAMVDAMKGAGLKVNRRNVELIARGLINHVRLTDEFQDHVPDDVVPYSTLEHLYVPRDGYENLRVDRSLGKYLEAPVLHYSIGTKIRPSVLKELQRFGVTEVKAHSEPPPFQAEMIRGMSSLQHDPDWLVRGYGSGLKKSILTATHRGATSDELGTSFVPALARAVDFGHIGNVRQPEAGTKLPPEGQPLPEVNVGKPKLPYTAEIQLPKPEKKQTGGMSSLFKWAEARDVERQEAETALKKVGLDGGSANTGLKKTNKPIVNHQPPAPTPRPANVPGAANPSPQTAVPQPAASQSPQPQPQAQQPPVQSPMATPQKTQASGTDPVHPARQYHDPVAAQSQGYTPGHGAFAGMTPEQMTNFITGGGYQDDPSTYQGGTLGAAVRFGTGLDSNAMATLTRGPRNEQSSQDHFGYHDDLTGGHYLGDRGDAAPAPAPAKQDWTNEGLFAGGAIAATAAASKIPSVYNWLRGAKPPVPSVPSVTVVPPSARVPTPFVPKPIPPATPSSWSKLLGAGKAALPWLQRGAMALGPAFEGYGVDASAREAAGDKGRFSREYWQDVGRQSDEYFDWFTNPQNKPEGQSDLRAAGGRALHTLTLQNAIKLPVGIGRAVPRLGQQTVDSASAAGEMMTNDPIRQAKEQAEVATRGRLDRYDPEEWRRASQMAKQEMRENGILQGGLNAAFSYVPAMSDTVYRNVANLGLDRLAGGDGVLQTIQGNAAAEAKRKADNEAMSKQWTANYEQSKIEDAKWEADRPQRVAARRQDIISRSMSAPDKVTADDYHFLMQTTKDLADDIIASDAPDKVGAIERLITELPPAIQSDVLADFASRRRAARRLDGLPPQPNSYYRQMESNMYRQPGRN